MLRHRTSVGSVSYHVVVVFEQEAAKARTRATLRTAGGKYGRGSGAAPRLGSISRLSSGHRKFRNNNNDGKREKTMEH